MARERYELGGKTALITGAAGGIGAETARQLDCRGTRLALLDVNGAGVEETAAPLSDAEPFRADVTDPEQLEQVVAATVERTGGIDIVMANAGIAAPGLVEVQDPAEFERVIEINLLGVYRTVKVALPHVIERRGYVLVVASLAAPLHAPMMAQYNMAKAGVEAFGNSLRPELAGQGVKAGVAYFGFIDTPMVRGAMASSETAAKLRQRTGPIGAKDYPVEGAGAAVVRGMERRARVVFHPAWMRPLLVLRGIVQPLADVQARLIGSEKEFARERARAREGEPAGAETETERAAS